MAPECCLPGTIVVQRPDFPTKPSLRPRRRPCLTQLVQLVVSPPEEDEAHACGEMKMKMVGIVTVVSSQRGSPAQMPLLRNECFSFSFLKLSYVFLNTRARGIDLNFDSITFQVIRNFDFQYWANFVHFLECMLSVLILYHLDETYILDIPVVPASSQALLNQISFRIFLVLLHRSSSGSHTEHQ